jgi:hypothetical protein
MKFFTLNEKTTMSYGLVPRIRTQTPHRPSGSVLGSLQRRIHFYKHNSSSFGSNLEENQMKVALLIIKNIEDIELLIEKTPKN